MPRYKRSPLSLADMSLDGPPVRLRDLEAITGLSRTTILRDVRLGLLAAARRAGSHNTHLFVPRLDARRWLVRLGFHVTQTAASAPSVAKSDRVR